MSNGNTLCRCWCRCRCVGYHVSIDLQFDNTPCTHHNPAHASSHAMHKTISGGNFGPILKTEKFPTKMTAAKPPTSRVGSFRGGGP